MAGKSNRGRGKGKAGNPNPSSSVMPALGNPNPSYNVLPAPESSAAADLPSSAVTEGRNEMVKDGEMNGSANVSKEDEVKPVDGGLHLYTVPIKGQSGEKIELQLSPGDSVMDVRQFLLDAPETCFFTCYDLILHLKDGSMHHLEDYNEISDVGDITGGGCFLEMVPVLYDERSIRLHVRRARELLSLSGLHVSLSTTLALEDSAAGHVKTADISRNGIQDLESLVAIEDVTNSLGNLFSSAPKDIKCVERLVFSSFNPPPNYRRLQGDLIYIDVVTLEGSSYCITGSTKSFYVNSSTELVLDPRPSKAAYESNTLIALLQKISPKFKTGFREILDQRTSAHPFENVQALLPPSPWLGAYPVPDHKRDAVRAEDAASLSYGSELIGLQRDWNEELQSCREFPRSSSQERVIRSRALYKVSCDFVNAATKGAVGVINGCISPINPTDPEYFHMYVHNNIFFSFAVDSDFEQLLKDQMPKNIVNYDNHEPSTQASSDVAKSSVNDNGEACADSGASQDSQGVICATVNADSGASPDSEGDTCATVNASDAVAEAQIADSEQATYASSNNDLKGTKAFLEADVPGLHNLAMAIIDYRGYRVVAQSIIPGILQGDKSDSLLYGSVDNGKKICWSESFHSKVVEAAKHLHLKEHTVLDGSGNTIKLAAPVECKGIVGSDDRHYLLDLMRVTPRDSNYLGQEHRFCVLRPELIASFCEAEIAAKSSPSGISEDALKEPINDDTSDKDFDVSQVAEEASHSTSTVSFDQPLEILFNPNVLTEFKLADSKEEIEVDEALVRKAGSYLLDVVIPKFVQDLCSLDVSPIDGQTLTFALHNTGINVRYLGKIAGLVHHLPHLWDLFCCEIIVRSAKHVIKDILRDTQDHDIASTVANFLNCLVGTVLPAGTNGGSSKGQTKTQKKGHRNVPVPQPIKGRRLAHGLSGKNLSPNSHNTSEGVWTSIKEFVKFKYQFELPEDAQLKVKKVLFIRNLCQKVGLTIAARTYDFNSSAPFQASDVLDLQPVVKHAVPVCAEAKNLMEAGRSRMSEGSLNEAYTLFSEAFSLLQQITGPMHKDVASCCRYLAIVLYHAGDTAGAIIQQHRELIINERCLGLDHPDTAHSYGNMALFYHGLNQTDLALQHMSRTLFLLNLASGRDHPDVSATLVNVAMMHQDTGNMNIALRYLQEALKRNERLLGTEHIQTAVCYHALAIACNYMGALKLSVQHEKKTYDILVKQLGEEDSRTKDSETWLKTFEYREQQMNALKQKPPVANPGSPVNAIDLLKAHPGLLQAFQSTVNGSANSAATHRALNASLVREGLPRGRGFDERAARAAAEVRKKAAAKGLLRPTAAPSSSSLPQLTQLLNIINAGGSGSSASAAATAAPAAPAPTGVQANGPTVESSNGLVPNGTHAEANEVKGAVEDHQAPVGLGAKLSSLNSKKHRNRGKKNGIERQH